PNVIDLDNDPNFRPAPPTGMGLTMLDGGKMKLTWDASLRRNIAYHIYARPIDGSKWIRVTREPVAHNYQVFAQTKSGVSLMFVTTAVFNDQESDFSEPVSLDSRPAPKAAAQPA
ncbi:MAG: fibronectin type III domain-containing protein, partial [Calditrichaeota bacterium]|nr:fibronectin type III domain-containing protein [Calditrichota bacterium]